MPIRDRTRVVAGIFHRFRLGWIVAITDALNRAILPGEHHAPTERRAAGIGPHVRIRAEAGLES